MSGPRSAQQHSYLMSVLLLLIAMGSIQVGASLAKTLFHTVGAAGAVALRTAFATLMLAVVLRPWRTRFSAGAWPALAVYGGPLVVAVVSSRRAVDFLWAVLAAAGLVLLLPIAHAEANVDPTGVLFALGAGACWALYIVFGQKAGAEHGPQAVAIGSVIASIIVVPIGVAEAGVRLFSVAALPYEQ